MTVRALTTGITVPSGSGNTWNVRVTLPATGYPTDHEVNLRIVSSNTIVRADGNKIAFAKTTSIISTIGAGATRTYSTDGSVTKPTVSLEGAQQRATGGTVTWLVTFNENVNNLNATATNFTVSVGGADTNTGITVAEATANRSVRVSYLLSGTQN